MKKYLFIIATAAIVASCSDLDTVKEAQKGNDIAISFETFASKQTRAENSTASYNWAFFDHHNNFQVWGYKNTATVDKPVFNGDVVTVSSNGATNPTYTYSYSPIRYWDKAASEYEFYAAAPSDKYDATSNPSGWNFVSTGITTANIVTAPGQNNGYFTTKSLLAPSNIADGTTTLKQSFKNVADVDKMIAAPKAVPYAEFKSAVQLDFIHILSRINVTVKKDASLEPSDHKNQQKVVLNSLVIKNLLCAGDFDESKDDPESTVPGNNTRWENQATAKDYTAYASDVEVTTDANYFIQSLVIPQDAAFEVVALDGAEHASTPATYYATVEEYNAAKGLTGSDAKTSDWWTNTATENDKTKTPAGSQVKAVTDGTEPYLVLTYTIQQTHDAAGQELGTLPTAETFVAYFNLANAFGLQSGNLAFNEGWQNTLNITIKPAAIEFCAMVAEWSTYERGVTVD